MSVASERKRLGEIETCLTPKEWAIRLVREMRQYPSEVDFSKAVLQRDYRTWPWIEPFFRLAEQARRSHPNKDPQEQGTLVQHNRRLRLEFHALKILIGKINEIANSAAETIRLKAALKLSALQTLALKDAYSRTAARAALYIEQNTQEEQVQPIVDELKIYSDPRLSSLVEELADELTMLAIEVLIQEKVVQDVQDCYFDSNAILFQDVEAKLIAAGKLTRDAIQLFNEYSKARRGYFEANLNVENEVGSVSPEERAGHLVIDLENLKNTAFVLANAKVWMKNATELATADILRETGEHEVYIEKTFREEIKNLALFERFAAIVEN